jgi:integrase
MAAARLFLNEKTVKKDGKTAVYALVHIDNKSIKINTGVSVSLDRWDKKKGRIKGTDQDTKDDNLTIDKCLAAINEIFVRYRLQHKPLTADLLLREYKNPTFYVDFYAWMDQKINDRVRAKEVGAVTGKHQRVLLNKLKEYKPALSFAEIDLKFVTNFRNWLRTDKKNSVNTIQKNFGYFRAYLHIAVRDEIINVNPIDLIELKRTSVQIVYLTESEFKKLFDYYEKNEYQENYHQVLRHFLFMCLTGVRISDLKRLKKENVQESTLKFIPFKTRAKKGTELNIPIIEKAQKLIQDENSTTGYLFNTITDQKMNEYLKKIADLGGIPKKIRNHAGRHTFATMFLEKTDDVASLQKLLGHTNISETMKYVHISSRKIESQMLKFSEALNKKAGD